MELIADAVTIMYACEGEQHEELIFDDKEILLGALPETENEAITEIEKDVNGDGKGDDFGELLEDDSQTIKNKATDTIKYKQFDEEANY